MAKMVNFEPVVYNPSEEIWRDLDLAIDNPDADITFTKKDKRNILASSLVIIFIVACVFAFAIYLIGWIIIIVAPIADGLRHFHEHIINSALNQ